MGADAFIEPFVVFAILTAGVLANRRVDDPKDRDGTRSPGSPTSASSLLPQLDTQVQWRERRFFGKVVKTRNTARWKGTLVSRLLDRFPFLVEVWYWLLVYWTYQLGRAFTAVTLKEDTVDVARLHGLSVIAAERKLGVFRELAVQGWFLERPALLKIINCVYSFIHIPGTITFLAWLYHYAPSSLYQARRRTLAVCNLMAFVVFTLWPCMPPRLLPKEDGFGFVDTVHVGKVSSVWTTNKFCNQLAAMPSLHFGYSFVIGMTIATMPNTSTLQAASIWRRVILVIVGVGYPLLILIAIVATANHYVLDAVAGLFVAVMAWRFNGVLCNLLPFEDYVYYALRIHKPAPEENVVFAAADKFGDEEDWWRRA